MRLALYDKVDINSEAVWVTITIKVGMYSSMYYVLASK